MDYYSIGESAIESLRDIELYLRNSGLDSLLLEIIRLRSSQINGCSHCVELHVNKAKQLGVDEDKLHMVAAWKDADCFTSRERIALEWTEAVTQISDGISTELVQKVREEFSDKEIVDLTICVGVINVWNRLAVSLG